MEFDTHDARMAPVMDLMTRGQFDRAYALCRPLAEDGSPDAQLRVGWMFHTGNGVLKSVEQAHYWYERAVLAGSAQAEFYLGSLFWNSHEFQKALEWFQRSAAHGFVPALYHLARMYRHGVGVENR